MTPIQKKYLARAVTLMCAIVVFSFVSVLFNGTLFFFSNSSEDETKEPKIFRDLIIGQPELRRINKQLVWVTYLTTAQRDQLNVMTDEIHKPGQSCLISEQYCVLLAETQRLGVSLQYTSKAPSQLPSDVPWFGGFVNPLNGAIYDLLGRAYLFQGEVEELSVVRVGG